MPELQANVQCAVIERYPTRENLTEWARFFRSDAHILSQEPQLLLQQALNRPDDHTIALAASHYFQRRGSSRPLVQWINKPQTRDASLLTLSTESSKNLRFSPTGSRLLTWSHSSPSEPGEAMLWDISNGRLIGRWQKVCVGDPPFVPLEPGSYVFTLLSEGIVWLYDAESGADLQTLAQAPEDVRHFSVAAGARKVAFGCEDGHVRLVDSGGGAVPTELTNYADSVESVRFLLEGRRLLCRDKSVVRLFDVQSGSQLLEEPDRDGWTYEHFEVSSNEQWLVLEQKNVDEGKGWTTLWKMETGRGGMPVTGEGHAITTWGISSGGDSVLAIEFELGDVTRAQLEIWGVASNRKERTFPLGWLSPFPPARFSADGRWLAVGRCQPTEPGDIELWDLHSRSESRAAHFQGHSSFIWDLAFSADGRTLASVDSDRVVRLWALPVDGASIQPNELPRHATEVESCVFTPDGRLVMSSCAQVQGFQHGQDPTGATKLVPITHAEIRIWDGETGAPLQIIDAGQHQPNCFAFSPDSKHLAVSSSHFGGEAIRIWNRGQMVAEAELAGHRSSVGGCSYTRDGRRLVSMCFSTFRSRPEDNALKIWDPVEAIEVETLIGHRGEITGFAVSPNGRFAVASSEVVASAVNVPGVIADRKGDFFDALSGPTVPVDLFLWDLEKRAKCASLEECSSPTFSPDGQSVMAVSAADRWAVLWQFATSETPSTRAIRSGVSAAVFTPGGREVALALNDGGVALVDPNTGLERLRLRRQSKRMFEGRFSPDGRYLIDTTATIVRVWDLVSGNQVAAFPTPADLKRVAIGPDITRLAVGDKLGGVSLLRILGLEPGPAIVTTVRAWRFGPHGIWRRRFGFFTRGHWDKQLTAVCPFCESAFVPAPTVLDAVESIGRDARLRDGVAPTIALPREAWDEKRLLASCPQCKTPLRFSPFFA